MNIKAAPIGQLFVMIPVVKRWVSPCPENITAYAHTEPLRLPSFKWITTIALLVLSTNKLFRGEQ
ncbi:hypothetical protein [Pseudomonas sp. TWI628]|uniref:hypothetical protein n=1 Tax=Pseudomonas sp. TWI628 TaxID=3136788 RepID=UPI003207CB5F